MSNYGWVDQLEKGRETKGGWRGGMMRPHDQVHLASALHILKPQFVQVVLRQGH